jgi:hypothetical protein
VKRLHAKHFFISGYHILNTPLNSSSVLKIWVIFKYYVYDIIQWVLGALSLGVKQVEYEADHSCHLTLRLRMNERISPLPVMPSWLAHGKLPDMFELEVSGLLLHHLLISSQHYFIELLFITFFEEKLVQGQKV